MTFNIGDKVIVHDIVSMAATVIDVKDTDIYVEYDMVPITWRATLRKDGTHKTIMHHNSIEKI